MAKENAKEKIQKLLNLASNNPSEEEAQAAMLRAKELMLKYRIEEGDLEDPDKQVVNEVDTDVTCTSVVDPWIAQLAKCIAQNYRCESFMRQRKNSRQKRMIIIGLGDDPEVATSIFLYARSVIYHEIDAMRARARKKGWTIRDMRPITDSYARGFIIGLKDKFESQKNEHPEWALVAVTPQPVIDQISNLTATNMDSKFQFSEAAYRVGYQDGSEFSPERSVSGAAEKPSGPVLALN